MRTIPFGSSQDQQADLYLPSAAHPPTVCLLHGGFWRMPHGRDQLDAIAFDLVARGYAVWNIGYRRVGAPGVAWPATLEDVELAIDHLATLVDQGIDLDLDRVVVAGHSAGGQLALYVSARFESGQSRMTSRVSPIAAAGLAAVVDLQRAHELDSGAGAVPALLGGTPSQVPERYAVASPVQLLPLGVPQLILHGARDEVLPIELAERYVERARGLGDAVEFPELRDCGHMDFVDPLSSAHAAFCEWLSRTLLLSASARTDGLGQKLKEFDSKIHGGEMMTDAPNGKEFR